MAVGFKQEEERVYTFRVKASVSDYIWDDERIERAEERLERAFSQFDAEVGAIANTMYELDTIETLSVTRGGSKTI